MAAASADVERVVAQAEAVLKSKSLNYGKRRNDDGSVGLGMGFTTELEDGRVKRKRYEVIVTSKGSKVVMRGSPNWDIAPGDARDRAALFALLVNQDLTIGALDLNPESGEVCFRVSFGYAGVDDVRSAIDTHLSVLDDIFCKYIEPLERVVEGRQDPVAALRALAMARMPTMQRQLVELMDRVRAGSGSDSEQGGGAQQGQGQENEEDEETTSEREDS
jgi:hypothetical protein